MTTAPDDPESLERQRRRMEALGFLADGVIHEINNHLQPIITFARLAQERAEDRPDIHADLEFFLESARRAAGLTGRLLAFSRTEALGARPVAFVEEVARAVALIRRSSPAAVEIRTHLAEDHGQVDASAHEVFQVLSHLVANAVQAMGGHGVVSVELERTGPAARPHFRLTVADTGCGMDADTLARLFDPLSLAKPPDRQTGLGLPLVYRLVARWHGVLQVSSRPGQGTTLTLSVPVL